MAFEWDRNGTYCVYRHIRPDTDIVFYIGIGSSIRRSKLKSGRNVHWHNIVNKNNGNYIVEIIFKNISKEFAIYKEIELIKLYGRIDLDTGILCNKMDGGEGVSGLSEEGRCRLSDATTKRLTGNTISQEIREKISKTLMGHSVSDETKKKMRDNKIPRSLTDAEKINLSIKFKGRFVSEETRIKIGNIFRDRKHSEESKIKMSIAQKELNRYRIPAGAKLVLNLETGIYYNTIVDCAFSMGLSRSILYKGMINGKFNNIVVLGYNC